MANRRDRELAKMLYPKPSEVVEEGLGARVQSTYAYGTAASDSDGGTVTVVMEGETAGVDAAIEVPTSCAISEGDTVLVSVSGNVPVEAVSKGSGDVTRGMAEATTQHFWTDSAGIHVTEVDQETFIANPQGANQLSNSQGILLRDGTTTLASFTPTAVQIGKTGGSNITVGTSSTTFNTSNGEALAITGSTTSSKIAASGSRGLTIGAEYDSANYSRITLQNTPSDPLSEVTINTMSNGVTGDLSFANDGVTSELLINNRKLLAIETYSVTVPSTSAGSNYSSSAIDITKNGYTPVGVIQTYWSSGSGQNKFNDYGTHTEGNDLYVRLWNAGTGAANGTLEVIVLYANNAII